MFRAIMGNRARVLGLVFAITWSACGPTLGVRGRAAVSAAEYLQCEHITRVVQLADDAFEVDGCGDIVEYTRGGRSSDDPLIPMRPAATLAAADTGCSVDQLTTVGARAPAHRTFGGCGATVSYALACMSGIGCEWRREGEVARVSVAVPAPAPTGPGVLTPVPPPPGAP